MELEHIVEEMNALRRALSLVDGLSGLAEGQYRHQWGLPIEELDELRHTLTARYGCLALQIDTMKEWKEIPDAKA